MSAVDASTFLTPYLEGLPSEGDARTEEGDRRVIASLVEAGQERLRASLPEGEAAVDPAETDFPVGSLPEVAADALDGRTLASAILRHGVLLVRGLYRPEHLERLLRAADLEEERGFQKQLGHRCSDRTLLELLTVYESCGLLRVVREYLGGAPLMMRERAELRKAYARPGVPLGLPWHQDVSFFGTAPGGINCWASVTGAGDRSPGLVVVPRRFEEPVFWDLSKGRAPLNYAAHMPPAVLKEASRDHPPVEPVMQPGDALLFDEMTLHRSGVTRWSADIGVVSISWFFRPSRFLEGRTPLAI